MNKNELKALLMAKLSEMVDHLDWEQSTFDEVCTLELRQVIRPHTGYPVSHSVTKVEYLVVYQDNDDRIFTEFYGQNEEYSHVSELSEEKKVTEVKYYYPERVEEVDIVTSHTITRDYDPDYDGEDVSEEDVEEVLERDLPGCDLTGTGYCYYPELPCKNCVLNTDR